MQIASPRKLAGKRWTDHFSSHLIGVRENLKKLLTVDVVSAHSSTVAVKKHTGDVWSDTKSADLIAHHRHPRWAFYLLLLNASQAIPFSKKILLTFLISTTSQLPIDAVNSLQIVFCFSFRTFVSCRSRFRIAHIEFKRTDIGRCHLTELFEWWFRSNTFWICQFWGEKLWAWMFFEKSDAFGSSSHILPIQPDIFRGLELSYSLIFKFRILSEYG